MGSDPEARLAYGHDLGGGEPWYLAEASGEYGELAVDWYDNESYDGFAAQLIARLYALIPDSPPTDWAGDHDKPVRDHWGIELVRSGDPEAGAGYVLAVVDNGRGRAYSSVEWSETMALDIAELATRPARESWDARLATVMTALGITPVREVEGPDAPSRPRPTEPTGPRWLVFPYYG